MNASFRFHKLFASQFQRALAALQIVTCSHESIFSTGQGSVEMVVVRISTRSAFYIHEWCVSFILYLILSDLCLLTSSRKYCLVERISKKHICLALWYIPWSIIVVISGLPFTLFVRLHVHVHAWCIYTYLHLWTHHGNLVWLKKFLPSNRASYAHIAWLKLTPEARST